MLNLNPTTLAAVVDQARTDAAQHPRWLTAIDSAVRELVSNPWIERADGDLLIASPSGSVYSANGVCQCDAYRFNNPCWHRAAARLVRLHDERQSADRGLALGLIDRTDEPIGPASYGEYIPLAPAITEADRAAYRRKLAEEAAALLNECF